MLRCKFERLQRKWTQGDAARETGIPQTDISAIERGRANPTREELAALSQAYDIPADALLKEVTVISAASPLA